MHGVRAIVPLADVRHNLQKVDATLGTIVLSLFQVKRNGGELGILA